MIAEPLESPAIVPKAKRVHHRAEDLHELSADAAASDADGDDRLRESLREGGPNSA